MALAKYYSAAEVSLAKDMRLIRCMSWRSIGSAMRRDPSSLSKACGKLRRRGYGPLTEDEIEAATQLRALGMTWKEIGQTLERADGSGLRKKVLLRAPHCQNKRVQQVHWFGKNQRHGPDDNMQETAAAQR